MNLQNINWYSENLKKKYEDILRKCYNENDKDYRFYGAKGIKLCDKWLNNPQDFNDYFVSIGYTNDSALGRKDTTKDYSEENCILTTVSEAAKWKITTTKITVNGITDSGKGWARRLNLGVNHINKYIKKNGLEKTIEYVQSLLDGSFVFENNYKEHEIKVGRVVDNGNGWDKRLNLYKGTINSYIKKYGEKKVIDFIRKRQKDPNYKIEIKKKKKTKKIKKCKIKKQIVRTNIIKKSKKERKTIVNDFVGVEIQKDQIKQFKQIERLPRYYITTDFHVYDSEKKCLLNEYRNNEYTHIFVSICVDDIRRTTMWVHRLVYEAYYGEIEEGYDIHHIDEDKSNNNINNLQKLLHEEHCRLHGTEIIYDKVMICPQCGKKFLWTAQKQKNFKRNLSRKIKSNKICQPFCFKECIGKYGRENQIKNGTINRRENKTKHNFVIDVFYNGEYIKTFDYFEDCSEYIHQQTNAKKYNINSGIRTVLQHKRNSYFGFTFIHKE